MSNPMLMTKSYEIGGRDYQLLPLTVAEARPILAILQRGVSAMNVNNGAVKDIVLTCLTGGLWTDADVDMMVKAFGPKTTVTVHDEGAKEPRTLLLSKEANQNELFAGQFELMYEWIEASITFNFAGTLAKLYAVMAATVEYAKTVPELKSQLG
jgi:hypothetical protein